MYRFPTKTKSKKIDLYLDKLKEIGLESEARKVFDLDPTIPNLWRKKNNFYYILERVNAKTGSQSV